MYSRLSNVIILVALVSSSTMANYESLLWNSNTKVSTSSILFVGFGGGQENLTISSMNYGTSTSTAYCSTTEDWVPVEEIAEDYVFAPKNLVIDGINLPVTLTSDSPFTDFNNEYYFLRNKRNTGDGLESYRRCELPTGSVFNLTHSTPVINMVVSIPSALGVGHYVGSYVLKNSFGEFWRDGSSSFQFPSDATVLQLSVGDITVPYDITILNQCTVNPTSIELAHGALNASVADGNIKESQIVLNCTAPVDVELTLTPITGSSIVYPDGAGIALGHGWDSLLKIIDNGTGAAGSNVIVSVEPNVNTPLTIRSQLKSTAVATAGALNGSAILVVTYP